MTSIEYLVKNLTCINKYAQFTTIKQFKGACSDPKPHSLTLFKYMNILLLEVESHCQLIKVPFPIHSHIMPILFKDMDFLYFSHKGFMGEVTYAKSV